MRLLATLLVSIFLSAGALAQSSFDDQPIRRISDPNSSTTQSIARQTSSGVDLSRLLIATLLVIALIFVVRWIAQKWLPSARGGSTGSVRLISRTNIGARQQILLVMVGRRLLILADSGGSVSRLGEIENEDEIAQLIGSMESSKESGRFNSLFKREQDQFEDEPTDETSNQTETQFTDQVELQSDLKSLLERVKSVSKQLDQK